MFRTFAKMATRNAKMIVRVEPVREADLPATHEVLFTAFRDHPRMPMLWPRGETEDRFAYHYSRALEDLKDPTCRLMKATDTSTGKIVGSSEWAVIDAKTSAEKVPTAQDAAPPPDWPKDGNWEMRRYYTINLERLIKKYLPQQAYIELHLLSVLPEAQHQGVGSKLLTWGIEEADRQGVAMCLEATPEGRALYEKNGFREIETIDADMRDFGWTKPYDRDAAIRIFMIRDARKV